MATKLGMISPLSFQTNGIFNFHRTQIYHDIPDKNVISPKVPIFHQKVENKEDENSEAQDENDEPVSYVKEIDDISDTADSEQKKADIPQEKASGFDEAESSNDFYPEVFNDSKEKNNLNGEFVCDTLSSSQKIPFSKKYIADKYIEVTTNIVTDEDDRKVFLYECKVCNKTYRSRDSARKHMHGHYGFKPFKCQLCEKAFVEKKVLQIHMRTHTGEKPYSCQLCNKSFSQSIQLLRHKRMHTGNTPYKCDICNKVFSQRFCVERHRKVHFHPKIKRYQNNALETKAIDSTDNVLNNMENDQMKTECFSSDQYSTDHENDFINSKQSTVVHRADMLAASSGESTLKKRKYVDYSSAVTSPKGILLKRYKEENSLSESMNSDNLNVGDRQETFEVKPGDVKESATCKLKRRKQNHPQKKMKQKLEVGDTGVSQTTSEPDKHINISDSQITDLQTPLQSKCCSGVELSISDGKETHSIDTRWSDVKNLSKNYSDETKVNSSDSGRADAENRQVDFTDHIIQSNNTKSKQVNSFETSFPSPDVNNTSEIRLGNKYSKLPATSSNSSASPQNHPSHSIIQMPPFYNERDGKKNDATFYDSSVPLPLSLSNSLPFGSRFTYPQSLLHNPLYSFPGILAQNAAFVNQSVSNIDYMSSINTENNHCQSQALDLSKKSCEKKQKYVDHNSVSEKISVSSPENVKPNNDVPDMSKKVMCEKEMEPIICTICNKHYRSKENLRKHMKKHEGSKPHKCDQCGKAFLDKKVLEIHYRRHTGEKPYRCEDCDVGYAQSVQLLRHMRRVHTRDFPFHCEYCHKGFSCNFTLRRHVRIHTGEKPFVCELCGEAFAYDTSYKIHVMRHSGEQPHECFCGKKFLQKSRLILHQESHSPSEFVSKKHSLEDAIPRNEELLKHAMENFQKSIMNFSRQFCTGADVAPDKLLNLTNGTEVKNLEMNEGCDLQTHDNFSDSAVSMSDWHNTELSSDSVPSVVA